MKFDRSSGILIHPSSFPGRYGIGDLGPAAYTFLDFLNNAGCKLWQILPLGPTGYGDSPYQSFSSFAGNPYLISPEILLIDGLIHSDDLVEEMDFPQLRVDYGKIIPWKLNLLEKAYNNFNRNHPFFDGYNEFCHENEYWLLDYAHFMALKEIFGGASWTCFPESLRSRDPLSIQESRENLKNIIDRYRFYQFIFFKQWRSVKIYAEKIGIRIIGDTPLYVAHDSADVWANSELFKLEPKGEPTFVAGVPPDYFSSTGQLWGNPIYDWRKHKEEGFQWWIERIKRTLNSVDLIRLDHFRGFVKFWQIPAGNLTAQKGQWVQGPGIDFFRQLSDALGFSMNFPIIAEDLGIITNDVIELRDELGLPGMKILQFAFTDAKNLFLPHHYSQNYVVYTGSHDNDTSEGWFKSASEKEKMFAEEYMKIDGSDIAWDLIRLGWASVAGYAITPMQDILRLDSCARMNFPGRVGGNWEWRLPEDYNQDDLINKLKKINEIYGRV